MPLARRPRLGRRRWIVTAAVVGVASAAGSAVALTRSSAAATTQSVVETVGAGTLRTTVAATGTIEPAQQADLSFAVSGQVTAVPVSVGQKVTTGQVLATVNSASLAATVAQAQATVAADAARVSNDGSSAATPAQLAADQAALSAANTQLGNAQQALSEATLTAPIAGTVAAVNVTVGQQVGGPSGGSSAAAASSSAGSNGSDIVIVSTSSYVVNASVDDTVVGQLRPGDQAVITPDGATTPVYGVVSTVAVLPSSTSGVPAYPVRIDVTGDPPGLYPGASASVAIVVRQLTNVLEVPTAAIHYSGGRPTVTVWRGGAGHPVAIGVGLTSAAETQVTSGLTAGEQVLVTRTLPAAGTGARRPGAGSSTPRRFGGGGFGGGGFGGGGFGGGGFGAGGGG